MRIAPGTASSPVPTSPPPPRPARSSPPTFAAILGDRPPGGAPAPVPASGGPRPPPPRPTPAPSPVRTFFDRAIGAESKIDALVHAAATGKTFSPGELLALQSTVFRYSQTVEVISRTADRVVGAIKQTMGTQV
jgi:hypothetical protein